VTDIQPAEATLEDLEAIIESNLTGALAFANALSEIHDRKLYKATHSSFEAYCLERWTLSRSAVWRRIAQVKATAELPPGSPLPPQDPRSTRPERRKQNVASRDKKPPAKPIVIDAESTDVPKPATFVPDGSVTTERVDTYSITITPDAELGKQILKASKKMPAYDWVILAVREKLAAREEDSQIAVLKGQIDHLKAENKRLVTELNAALTKNYEESPRPPVAKRSTAPKPSARQADCVHPITRRIGTMCAACGKEKV